MLIGRLNNLVNNHILTEQLQSKLLFLEEAAACFSDAHQKYLDFHFILEGKENIAVDHIEHQKVIEVKKRMPSFLKVM